MTSLLDRFDTRLQEDNRVFALTWGTIMVVQLFLGVLVLLTQ